jgi:hypothetical protein
MQCDCTIGNCMPFPDCQEGVASRIRRQNKKERRSKTGSSRLVVIPASCRGSRPFACMLSCSTHLSVILRHTLICHPAAHTYLSSCGLSAGSRTFAGIISCRLSAACLLTTVILPSFSLKYFASIKSLIKFRN